MIPSQRTGRWARTAGHRTLRRPHAAHDHQAGAAGDDHQAPVPDPPWRPGGGRQTQPDPHRADAGEHGPPTGPTGRTGQRPHHGGHAPEQQLPCPGVGAEIGPVGTEAVRRHPHPHRRADRQDHGDHAQAERPAMPPPRSDEEDQLRQHQRPDQVVLLLDGERPGLLDRVDRRELGEVSVSGDDLLPVGDVEERGQGGVAELGGDQPGAARPARRGRGPPAGPGRPAAAAAPGVPRTPGAFPQTGRHRAGCR